MATTAAATSASSASWSTQVEQDIVTRAIGRLKVNELRSVLKDFQMSTIVKVNPSLTGLKAALVGRIEAAFTELRSPLRKEEYDEARRILERQFGSAIAPESFPSYRRSVGYTPTTARPQWPAVTPHPNAYPSTFAAYPGTPHASHQPYAGPSSSATNANNGYRFGTVSGSNLAAGTYVQPQRRMGVFQKSPFYRIKEWITLPQYCPTAHYSKAPPVRLPFKLNAEQCNSIANDSAATQIRLFCTTDAANQASMDGRHPAPIEFPLTCDVRVNKAVLSVNLRAKKTPAKVLAPNVNKDKRLSLSSTAFNEVELIYAETVVPYVIALAVCESVSSETLATRVAKEHVKSKETVLKEMKRAADDDDIEVGEVTINLKCPLSYMRLAIPCRSSICSHIQCFDALSFFSVNEVKPTWLCPICVQKIDPATLFLDGYVQDILKRVPEDEEAVNIDSDGRWRTPNNRYRSDAVASTAPAAGKSSNGHATDPASTNGHTENSTNDSLEHHKVKGEAAESSRRLSELPTPPPAAPSAGKSIEVYELDDTPSPPSSLTAATSTGQPDVAIPITTASVQPDTPHAPASAMSSARTVGPIGKPSNSHLSITDYRGMPTPSSSTASEDASAILVNSHDSDARSNAVIDLTMSDSDDADDVPVRRALPSTSMLPVEANRSANMSRVPAATGAQSPLPSTSMLGVGANTGWSSSSSSSSSISAPAGQTIRRAPSGVQRPTAISNTRPLDRYLTPIPRPGMNGSSSNKSASKAPPHTTTSTPSPVVSSTAPAIMKRVSHISEVPLHADYTFTNFLKLYRKEPPQSLPPIRKTPQASGPPTLYVITQQTSRFSDEIEAELHRLAVMLAVKHRSKGVDAATRPVSQADNARVERDERDEDDDGSEPVGRPRKRPRHANGHLSQGDAHQSAEPENGRHDEAEVDEFADLEFPDDEMLLNLVDPASGLANGAVQAQDPQASKANGITASTLGDRLLNGRSTPESGQINSNAGDDRLYVDERAGLGAGPAV